MNNFQCFKIICRENKLESSNVYYFECTMSSRTQLQKTTAQTCILKNSTVTKRTKKT